MAYLECVSLDEMRARSSSEGIVFCFAGVQLPDAVRELLVPGFVDTLVCYGIQAVGQRRGQIRPLLLGERESFLEEVHGLLGHSSIVGRPNVLCDASAISYGSPSIPGIGVRVRGGNGDLAGW